MNHSNVIDLYKLGVYYSTRHEWFLLKHGETVARIESMHHKRLDSQKRKTA